MSNVPETQRKTGYVSRAAAVNEQSKRKEREGEKIQTETATVLKAIV